MRVEFIYDSDCPNVAATRANLLRAFSKLSMPARWTEWERSDAKSPRYAREFGSPAILINGRDAAGLAPNAAPSCRIYRMGSGGPCGVPSVETILSALKTANEPEPRRSVGFLKRQIPIVPAVLFAILPKAACPACWPAYAALLSAFGLGFLVKARYLLPLSVAFLAIVLIGLGYRASRLWTFVNRPRGIAADRRRQVSGGIRFSVLLRPRPAGRSLALEYVATQNQTRAVL